MYKSYQQRLKALQDKQQGHVLHGGRKGIEKESLRTTASGHLAQTTHPKALGAAFAHPSITTDYSEALLELVTAPHKDIRDAIQELEDIHNFVYANIEDELLWNASMPCIVHGEASIPIGRYGSSNAGKMKEVYRLGLGHRYGRVMQAIAGIHFNYSLPDEFWPVLQEIEQNNEPLQDFRSAGYFGLVRNYLRYDWLTLYLFGASPAVCKSFFADMPENKFASFDEHTVYEEGSTTLRMSDIGYQNKPGLEISLNHVDEYVNTLNKAVASPHPPFQEIGLCVDGEYRQVSENILQIANEYYNAIRPKQPMLAGERPTTALARRGVSYVEVRSLDINPLDPIGVNETQLRFIELLLIFCALSDSPPLTQEEEKRIRLNQKITALHGRKAGQELHTSSGTQPLREWGLEIMAQLRPLAAMLDAHEEGNPYQDALEVQTKKVDNSALTPSAQMLSEMKREDVSFYAYAMVQAKLARHHFEHNPLSEEENAHYQTLAQQSHEKQAAVEAADTLSFADYLTAYFNS